MPLSGKGEKLFQNCIKILVIISYSIVREFDTEPVCNEKYIKAKTKSYNGKINTNLHDIIIPKDSCCCICLSNIN